MGRVVDVRTPLIAVRERAPDEVRREDAEHAGGTPRRTRSRYVEESPASHSDPLGQLPIELETTHAIAIRNYAIGRRSQLRTLA